MICPGCGAGLGRINPRGEPLIRARALILKAECVAVVCPRCKGDVPVEGDLAKALSARLLLVFGAGGKR